MRIAIIQYDRTQRASVAKKLVSGVFGDAEVTLINLRAMATGMWVPKKRRKKEVCS